MHMENSISEILIQSDITQMLSYTIGNSKIMNFKSENVGRTKLFPKRKHNSSFLSLQSQKSLNKKAENTQL